MPNVYEEIQQAHERAKTLPLPDGRSTAEFDKSNSQNDWVAYVTAYAGRAAQKVFRNEREGCTFRENMLKAAGLIVAAIEAHDAGYC